MPTARPNARLALLLILLLPGGTAAGRQGGQATIASDVVTPPAAEIAAALQRRYDGVKAFSADFTQTYEGGLLRRKAVESGRVFIEKPGRMRWEYERPQKKLFVSDGKTLYTYFPDDKQVLRAAMPAHDQATSAVMFLLGKGDVSRDFTVRYAKDGAPDAYVLRLEPRSRQAEYEWLQVAADRDTLQIRSLTAADAQGGTSTFTFSKFKENPRLGGKLFEFTVPRGAEVIDQ